MKAVGIICEYNPFHNGHLYHLNQVKKIAQGSIIILVLGGNFTQRGEASIIDKWDKTKIALANGVDLIVELPFPFATQSADVFARGSIEILDSLKVEKLIFGSEHNHVETLKKLANIQLQDQYHYLVKDHLSKGLSYPTATSKALYDLTKENIKDPNDLLALSYIKSILELKSKIEPISILRKFKYHDTKIHGTIASASTIRRLLYEGGNIQKVVPDITLNSIKNPIFMQDYFPLLQYKILTEKNNLQKYQTVDEQLSSRIYKAALNATSLDELITKIKTKRYTYNKITRMLTHILCNFTKEEALKFRHIEYIRILGFSKKGQNYLKEIKKYSKIPIITNYKQIKSDMLNLEYRVNCVYASIYSKNKKISMMDREYKTPPLH